jgi:hypothetical protein
LLVQSSAAVFLLLALAVYFEQLMNFCNGLHCSLLWSEDFNANAKTISELKESYLTSLHNFPFAIADSWGMWCTGKVADIGSHIIEKYAATWTRTNRCSMDKVKN